MPSPTHASVLDLRCFAPRPVRQALCAQIMNTELTNEELILLWDATISNINSQFELWLTITFAVIIASYIAGHRLRKSLQILIATLYVAVSLLLFLMLVGTVSFASQFSGIGIFVDPTMGELTIAVLRGGVWVLGTIATLIFIFKGHRDDEAST